MPDWPHWWDWELEFTPHLLKRMVDRDFTEADLRVMLESASGWADNIAPNRFTITARHDGRPWEVIVEPDPDEERLVVITAFPVD
ncbi:MAG: DUF4258 domain-containing protein [Planctomycetota bacterium]